MFWCCVTELDLCVGLLMIIVYGLVSLRHKQVLIADVHLFCQCWPLLSVLMTSFSCTCISDYAFDLALSALTFCILLRFKSFESLLLMMMAYIGQAFMLHSCDLVSFYVCLEGQNFCFLVLSGLQPQNGFSVESCLKYLLLSAFSSGMLLFWFSALYLRTGMSALWFQLATEVHSSASTAFLHSLLFNESFMILLAVLFKLGTAPMHLWVVNIYQSVSKPLLMYVSTAPKLSLFCFWVSAWHQVWTDFSVALFVGFSMALGSLAAYGQPALRALFAYSTINEIGLLLLAVETAGFHSMLQHLGIYIITQLLLWNLTSKPLFSVCAVSLAGLPPLAGFFGKAWIFWHVVSTQTMTLLAIALACTVLSLVYYLRVLRLFWYSSSNEPNGSSAHASLLTLTVMRPVYHAHQDAAALPSYARNVDSSARGAVSAGFSSSSVASEKPSEGFNSACVIALAFLPMFLVKPFVL